MIRISKIDSDLSIYKNNKVIICGGGSERGHGREMIAKFKNADIKIFALCDNQQGLWNTSFDGTPCISPADLKVLVDKNDDILVQIASGKTEEASIIRWLESINVHNFIHREEGINVLYTLEYLNLYKINSSFRKEFLRVCAETWTFLRKNHLWNHLINGNNGLLLCLPPKTGDHTLDTTFTNSNQIRFINLYHVVGSFNPLTVKMAKSKLKFITAVRDPIAQNISQLFQCIDDLRTASLMLTDIESVNEFLHDGGDAQKVFDRMIFDTMRYMEDLEPLGEFNTDGKTIEEIFDYLFTRVYNIQRFIPEFQKNILDIMQVPFDKEKGCTVIEGENIDVFVYQLEKLNNVLPELSEFTGADIRELTLSNTAEDKWCAKSYKQAQKELKLTKEYFDKCYDEPYVKHFYSEADIEKFKNKWKNNII